jgi:hypothetical protein
MMLDVRGTLLGNSSSGRFNPLKKRAGYLLGINRNGAQSHFGSNDRSKWEGRMRSQTTQLDRKMLYSNVKLHVSAYNGHHQVSIPIKGKAIYLSEGVLI